MTDHEQRDECAREFARIWAELETMDGLQRKQSEAIARVETHITNLLAGMDRLTRAMWGLVVTMATVGVGFIVWYIQSKGVMP